MTMSKIGVLTNYTAHTFRHPERKSKVRHGELPRVRHGGPEESQAVPGQVEGGEWAGLKSGNGTVGDFNIIRQHPRALQAARIVLLATGCCPLVGFSLGETSCTFSLMWSALAFESRQER